MLLKEFPDIHWLKSKIKEDFSDQQGWAGQSLKHPGWPNVVINARGRQLPREDIKGTLSLFSNIKGKSVVSVDGLGVPVGTDHFYVTNPGQTYSLGIEEENTETLNIHFGAHFLSQISDHLNKREESQLLEPGEDSSAEEVCFYNRLIAIDSDMQSNIQAALDAGRGEDEMHLEEALFPLILSLIGFQHQAVKKLLHLPVLKRSTREELGKRLYRAVDYMHAHLHQPISLDHLAGISCISKFHFMRLFKHTFQQSPHQYLTGLRLQKAEALLSQSDLALKDIALAIGLENTSSLTRLFSNHFLMTPSQYRKLKN